MIDHQPLHDRVKYEYDRFVKNENSESSLWSLIRDLDAALAAASVVGARYQRERNDLVAKIRAYHDGGHCLDYFGNGVWHQQVCSSLEAGLTDEAALTDGSDRLGRE